jgi:formylglycine-generating enzyme required for sulfatase activity
MKDRIFLLASALLAMSAEAEDASVYYSALAPLESFQECNECPEMIVMPSGSFMMGAIKGESRNPFDAYGENATFRRRTPDELNVIPFEHPRHHVAIDVPFALGRNEVTREEWLLCVDAGACDYNPSHVSLTLHAFRDLGKDHPVINVSFLDAIQFIGWLNEKVGKDVYRLPTEAEWEYAARSGTGTRFAQGDELTKEQANFSGRATEHVRGEGVTLPRLANRRVPVPVQLLDAANAWGLRHMSGNVHEITLSCWHPKHLEFSTTSLYLAHALSKASCPRVAKGGAFNVAMDGLRPASRVRRKETSRSDTVGFRVLRVLN